jgi:Thioesterase-like superfamily
MPVPTSVFEPAGESRFVATELARGPWDPDALHGGPPAALLMRAFERLPGGEDLLLARVTYELLRPVPLGELTLEAGVVRPGRRVQLLEASIRSSEGVEVMRARALRVRRSEAPPPGARDAPQPGPEQGKAAPFTHGSEQVMFARDTMEIRFIAGAFGDPGPATAWFRLRFPLLGGEPTTPLQRLAAAADFPNGIANAVPWEEYMFINPDLTIYLEREPTGEWICLDAQTRVGAGGVGVAEAVLYDERGRVGRAVQALLIARRPG